VLAEDPRVAAEVVQAVIDDGAKPLLALTLSDGESITVTVDHPFYVDSGLLLHGTGWLQAGQLQPGDRAHSGRARCGRRRATARGAGLAAVYTLTVAKDHTFFVGTARVLVHNAGGVCNNVIGAQAEAFVRYLTGGKKTTLYVTLAGRYQPRFVDVLTKSGTAYEVKAGEYSVRKLTRNQVAKDAELLRSGQVKEIIWAFFRSPIDQKIGPSPALESLLKANDIRIVLIEDPGAANL